MKTKEEYQSTIFQFAENLKQIPVDIIEGALNAMDDEDGKVIINAYSTVLKNQFAGIASLIQENAKTATVETLRIAEDLLIASSGIELTNQVKDVCKSMKSNKIKIGLGGIIQMIKKIIKWLIKYIFKDKLEWLDNLLDLIDEILNEIFGIGSPKLANILSRKEQNYLAELTQLAILIRAEHNLFDDSLENNLMV